MRLNGWQRIGIVASVIWAVGAPIYMDNTAERDAYHRWFSAYDLCRDVPTNEPEVCVQRVSKAHDNVPRYHFTSANGAFVALAPIPLGWLLAYALVYLMRWIRAGFAPSS
jgi:hypothetical protein